MKISYIWAETSGNLCHDKHFQYVSCTDKHVLSKCSLLYMSIGFLTDLGLHDFPLPADLHIILLASGMELKERISSELL